MASLIAGARYFTRFNIILFIGQMSAAALGILSFLIPHDYTDPNFPDEKRHVDFPKYFAKNVMSNYSSPYANSPCYGTGDGTCTYNAVFAIICSLLHFVV